MVKKATKQSDTTPVAPQKSRSPRVTTKEKAGKTGTSHLWTVLLTLLVVLLVELLYSIPSRWIHSDGVVGLFDGSLFQKAPLCTDDFSPVCGVDGRTYQNSCTIQNADVKVARVGRCSDDDTGGVIPPSEENDEEALSTASGGDTPIVVPLDISTLSGGTYAGSIQVYSNAIFDYELALPKYAYYRGYATADKKGHTLAIDTTAAATESFPTALVRVTYTRNGDTPPSDAKVTLPLEKGILSIAYDESITKQKQDVIDAIRSSAKSLE